MNLNKLILCAAFVAILSTNGCKKEASDNCTITDTTQTFTSKVKPILDASCAISGCHDAASAPSSGGVNLTTYAGAVDATKNKNLINQLQTGVMPQGGPVLPDSLINRIIAWKDNCYQN